MWDYFKQGSEKSCDLIDSLGIALQVLLFVISFSTLICNLNFKCNYVTLVKRNLERPQRPWKVFFMDLSKQAFSSVLLHTYNVVTSRYLGQSDNLECQWYFINFTVDILGIVIFAYFFNKLSIWIFRKVGIIFEPGIYKKLETRHHGEQGLENENSHNERMIS